MILSILILLAMPFTDLSRSRGIQFKPLSKIAFYIFVANFLVLMQLGAKHVESPFIELGQISTVIYFGYYLVLVPFISLLENSLIELPDAEQKDITSVKSSNVTNNFKVLTNNINVITYSSVIMFIYMLNGYIFNIDNCDTPRP